MKNLIILAVFLTALFGCSKTEEVSIADRNGEYYLETRYRLQNGMMISSISSDKCFRILLINNTIYHSNTNRTSSEPFVKTFVCLPNTEIRYYKTNNSNELNVPYISTSNTIKYEFEGNKIRYSNTNNNTKKEETILIYKKL